MSMNETGIRTARIARRLRLPSYLRRFWINYAVHRCLVPTPTLRASLAYAIQVTSW